MPAAVNIHRNSINNTTKNMGKGNIVDNIVHHDVHAFFFGNEQSIINALLLFMIRRPYELLNNNKATQGLKEYTYEKNTPYNLQNMDLTITNYRCRNAAYDDDTTKPTIDQHSKSMPLTHENRHLQWLRCSWSIFVHILFIAHHLFPCIEVSTMILDIQRDIVCWMILILHFILNILPYFVNIDNSQPYDRNSIAKKAFSFVTCISRFEIREFFIKRLEAWSRYILQNKVSRRLRNIMYNKNYFIKKKWLVLLTMINMIQFPSGTLGLRCYTDITASKSNSQECGLNTGCVKIYIDSEDMLSRKQMDMGFGYGYKPGMKWLLIMIKTICVS